MNEIITEPVIDPIVKEFMKKIDAIKEGILKDYYPMKLRDHKIASMVEKTIAEAIAPYQNQLSVYLSTRETTPYRFVCNIDQIVKIDVQPKE